MPRQMLDTTGLTCPLPVLKAKKVMRDVAPGEELEVVSTDPGAFEDFKAYCEATGHTLISATEEKGTYRFVILRHP